MLNIVKALAEKHYSSVVELRRYFHRHPELSKQEFNTQSKIIDELQALGLAPRKAAGTGVIADIKGASPGKTIALRADIDALPIQDETGTTYQSVNPGVCHACGHDGHTAMAIGAAKILTEMQEKLAGTVRLLFQPTEEYFPGGALALIEDGALEGVDAIIGAHLWQPLQVGILGITNSYMMAAPDEFVITIQGRGGHGSMPHQTVDPILIGSQLVIALNTIVSRNVDPLDSAALSLGAFKAGHAFNIIPDTAHLRGTVRSFEQNVRTNIFNRIEQITKGICDAAGANYTINKTFGYPPVVNDPAVSGIVAAVGKDILGREGVPDIKPVMGAEDFSYYLQKVPGAFMFIGAGNPEKGIIHPHHHPKFDIDETALLYGMQIMVNSAIRLMH